MTATAAGLIPAVAVHAVKNLDSRHACTEHECLLQGHALRAAINTPIQGSAADVATAAMLSIDACQELKELGWKMLLQVTSLNIIILLT